MPIKIAHDARPQVKTLLIAALLSIALWFIPYADILTYPFRIFVTFIHEGGHAFAAILTGNSVASLSVATNGSGETYTTQGGLFSALLISSAGYLGSMAFGALLLWLIRRNIAARYVLIGSAALILTLTLGYGLFSFSLFTLVSGFAITAGLIALAMYAAPRVATFAVSFLAMQCVLNAVLDLKTVLFLSSPFGPRVATDAGNLAQATGIPAIFWSIFWIGLAFVILSLAMRAYTTAKSKPVQEDLPFEDPMGV